MSNVVSLEAFKEERAVKIVEEALSPIEKLTVKQRLLCRIELASREELGDTLMTHEEYAKYSQLVEDLSQHVVNLVEKKNGEAK